MNENEWTIDCRVSFRTRSTLQECEEGSTHPRSAWVSPRRHSGTHKGDRCIPARGTAQEWTFLGKKESRYFAFSLVRLVSLLTLTLLCIEKGGEGLEQNYFARSKKGSVVQMLLTTFGGRQGTGVATRNFTQSRVSVNVNGDKSWMRSFPLRANLDAGPNASRRISMH